MADGQHQQGFRGGRGRGRGRGHGAGAGGYDRGGENDGRPNNGQQGGGGNNWRGGYNGRGGQQQGRGGPQQGRGGQQQGRGGQQQGRGGQQQGRGGQQQGRGGQQQAWGGQQQQSMGEQPPQSWPSLNTPVQPAPLPTTSAWGQVPAQTPAQPKPQTLAQTPTQPKPQTPATSIPPPTQSIPDVPYTQQPEGSAVQSSAERRPARGSTSEQGDAGRGAMRGKRRIADTVRSRPVDSVASKQGKIGTPVLLQANYFRVNRQGGESIFQYRVDFSPTVESRKMQNSIISNLKTLVGGYVFDGTQLFTRNKLRSDEVEVPTKEKFTNEDYIIKLRKVGTIDGTNEMALMMYNLINRDAMKGLKLTQHRRNYYDSHAKIDLHNYKLELHPGYVTSIRQHENDILMCAEITHRVLRKETCYNVLSNCMKDGNWRDSFKRTVLGSIVMADYAGNKSYMINDVDFKKNPEDKFQTKDGEISFMEYFRRRYGITIRDARQPLLVSRSKPRDIRGGMPELIYLIPELVRMTGLTDSMRQDFNLMRSVADCTRLTPDRRIERLQAFNTRLQQTKESMEIFQFWKTELDRRLVELPGRVLQPETIILDPQNVKTNVSVDQNGEWQSAFRGNPMYLSISLQNWFVICPRSAEQAIGPFLQTLQTVSNGMNFRLANPQVLIIPSDNLTEYVSKLHQVLQKDPQLVMCVVSNDKADRYAAIKKKSCVEFSVPTQVMKARTITPRSGNVRQLMSVATKVAIQMNCKLGGIPWLINNPLKSVLIIGYDVCHDTRDKSKSFGALVASMYTQQYRHPTFFSTIDHHSSGEEISNYMAQNVCKAIRAYMDEYKILPMRILIYRDGVGEGQLQHVYEHETLAIKEKLALACRETGPAPRMTFFVVNKRINTRLFLNKRNPAPGTVVDDVITLPERNDFYLVSQSVRQGTVSPTAYNILRDESGLNADQLQQLTYKQTHLYYNWSGTVGVPAVCQYAHKLAFLAGQYLHQSPSVALQNKLYYL